MYLVGRSALVTPVDLTRYHKFAIFVAGFLCLFRGLTQSLSKQTLLLGTVELN